jgi:hypothetical protein
MSATDSFTRSEVEALVRALIEEARQRARRRRRMYGGILIVVAVVGAIVFASFQRSAQSQNSPALPAGVNLPSYRLAASEHISHFWLPSKGKRGSFAIDVPGREGRRIRSWRLWGVDPLLGPGRGFMTGQYARITGGGDRVWSGGHQAAWSARYVGSVSRPGGAKQRVVITFKGRPNGTFVLTPLEPGVLKRDSGTQSSFATG